MCEALTRIELWENRLHGTTATPLGGVLLQTGFITVNRNPLICAGWNHQQITYFTVISNVRCSHKNRTVGKAIAWHNTNPTGWSALANGVYYSQWESAHLHCLKPSANNMFHCHQQCVRLSKKSNCETIDCISQDQPHWVECLCKYVWLQSIGILSFALAETISK